MLRVHSAGTLTKLSVGEIMALVRDDYKNDRTVSVVGWIISRTEAVLLTLIQVPTIMFLDARIVESNTQLSTDLCIVGGGAAGIALATGVSQAGLSTILLEAGGTEYDEKTQEVYGGVIKSDVLRSDYLTHSRLRYFGGTTNHWGGHSRGYQS